MPSREDLGTAHLDPPLDRVTLAPKQMDPAWTQKVPPWPDGRQRHLSAVWDLALEARGVQGTLRISFPCPNVVMGGSNLPEGQEVVGMFAYRLVSGHWRVQTGLTRHSWGPWAECGHGVGEAEAGVGGRGMACHACPCGEAAEGGG